MNSKDQRKNRRRLRKKSDATGDDSMTASQISVSRVSRSDLGMDDSYRADKPDERISDSFLYDKKAEE